MLEQICTSCRRPKANLNCGVCREFFCKGCVEFVEASTFSFLKKIPEILNHHYYCSPCYDEHVSPALASYNEILERARNLYFFTNNQKKPIPIIKRSKEEVRADDCDDRNKTILQLAFRAAELGFNSIIEAEVVSKKVRNESYQKSSWSGLGVPAQVDAEKLERSAGRYK
jgi:hypothetical protein